MPCSLTAQALPLVDFPANHTMFYEDQPVSDSRPACLNDPLSLGCRATSTHAGGRDGGAEVEGREVDRLVQPARAARQAQYGYWLNTVTGEKRDDRVGEPSEGEA